MGKFDGCLLYSDIDGTFVDNNGVVPKENLEAVEYFMSEGGKFGLATGRASYTSAVYAKQAGINAPGICYNGAMVYDYHKDETLFLEVPSKKTMEYVKIIFKKFPNIGLEFVYSDKIIACNVNEIVLKHFEYENIPHNETSMDKIKDGWLKVLFVDDIDNVTEVEEFIKSQNFDDANFVRSAPFLLEMISGNASKGGALMWVADRLGIDRNKIFAAGDFYNDITMITNAALGAFVENAPADLHGYGDVILCSNEKGAIADFVGKIEKNIEK